MRKQKRSKIKDALEFEQEKDQISAAERPSRTQKKKAAQNLQKLGGFLTTMSQSEIDKLDISHELKNALKTYKTIAAHGAKKRHLQYIGVLMRDIDISPLENVMDKLSLL